MRGSGDCVVLWNICHSGHLASLPLSPSFPFGISPFHLSLQVILVGLSIVWSYSGWAQGQADQSESFPRISIDAKGEIVSVFSLGLATVRITKVRSLWQLSLLSSGECLLEKEDSREDSWAER